MRHQPIQYEEYKGFLRTLGCLILFLIAVTACQNIDPTSEVTPEPQTSPSPDAYLVIYEQAWATSPHADNYSLEKGPNTYCAKCHSPENWDPSSTIDEPPNCVSCKFAFEPEPRMATGNPLVPEEEWKSIGCEICHRNDDGIISAQFAWFNPQTEFYETTPDSTALCEKCHLDNPSLRHKRDLGTEVHSGFTCTSCHDAHTTKANCGVDGCHLNVIQDRLLPSNKHVGIQSISDCLTCHPLGMQLHSMETRQIGEHDCLGCHSNYKNLSFGDLPLVEHSSIHTTVNCTACHDASGYDFNFSEETGEWLVYRTVEFLGRANVEAYQSHNLQRNVVCSRCHYEDNPWQLPDAVRENNYD